MSGSGPVPVRRHDAHPADLFHFFRQRHQTWRDNSIIIGYYDMHIFFLFVTIIHGTD